MASIGTLHTVQASIHGYLVLEVKTNLGCPRTQNKYMVVKISHYFNDCMSSYPRGGIQYNNVATDPPQL